MLFPVQGLLALSLFQWMCKTLACSIKNHIELVGRQMEQGFLVYILHGLELHPFLCIRYMMYICKAGEVYMLDRDNAVFSVPQLQFPSRKPAGAHVKETLVDGVRLCRVFFFTINLCCL